MEDLDHIVGRLRAAWMAGTSARGRCPEAWLPHVGGGPAAELALAALAGHALHTAFRPVPGGPLAVRETLPALALPPAPDAVRPRLRRLLAAHPSLVRQLLLFLAARGVTMHPADWLPDKRAADVPALYEPWIAWVSGGTPPPPAPTAKIPDIDALAAELAAMLAVEPVGLLRRRKRVTIGKLKTAPQHARRQDLFARVPLAALTAALGVTAADLVQVAPTGIEPGIAAFAAMVAASDAPEVACQLLSSMLDDADCPLAGAAPLAAPLDRDQAAALLPAVLRRTASPDFKLAVELAGAALGLASWPDIVAAPGYAALRAQLGAGETDRPAQVAIAAGLTALGLLASGRAARDLMAHGLDAGLSPADPKLDALHLNIALSPEDAA